MGGSDTLFAFHTQRDGAFAAARHGLRSEDFHCDAQLALPVAVDGGDPQTLRIPLGQETALQGTITAFCAAHDLPLRGQCALLAAVVADAAAPLAAAKQLGLPPVQASPPSAAEPFVFLHHEKCAGTSLRRYVARAARDLGLEIHVSWRAGCWFATWRHISHFN